MILGFIRIAESLVLLLRVVCASRPSRAAAAASLRSTLGLALALVAGTIALAALGPSRTMVLAVRYPLGGHRLGKPRGPQRRERR